MDLLNYMKLSFNFYYDIKFWLFFTIIVIIFRLLNNKPGTKNAFLFFSSMLMLFALPRFTYLSFLFLIVVSAICFFIGLFLISDTDRKYETKRTLISFIAIFVVVSLLVFFKYTLIQDAILKNLYWRPVHSSDIIFIIGISYLSFKLIHFIIECHKRNIHKLSILAFLNYIFFFPSFISGPITRYNEFTKQLIINNEDNLKADLKSGIERIIHGLFKKFVLSTMMYPYALVNMHSNINELNIYQILWGLYAYTFYFYFDFSGYSDIAIGSAQILGLKIPENFNRPFLKKNIQQLWANWHMSLTRWLTDYIFWPLSRWMRRLAYLKKRPVLLSNISIIITFVVCGMWHGESFNFVVWGSYHGVGLAALNVYQKQKRKIRNKFLINYFKSKYSEIIGIIVTFHFFVFGLLIFAFKMDEIGQLLMRFL